MSPQSATPSRVLAPFGRRAARVIEREVHGSYVVLRCADPAGPRPAPGQFYMLATATEWGGGDGERPFLPRAFSVMRAGPPEGVRATPPEDPRAGPPAGLGPRSPEGARARPLESAGPRSPEDAHARPPASPAAGPTLEFLIEDVGPGTHRLCALAPGEELLLVGPLGVGFAAPRDGRRPLLVGGGVGIAPLAIWQDELEGSSDGASGPAIALLGFRDGAHAEGAALLREARVATDDGSVGHHGLVTDLMSAEFDADPAATVYACGPPAMLEAVRALCAARAVPAQLALESGMACGYGACFGCVVATRRGLVRLCLEGPVLDADQLEFVSGAGTGTRAGTGTGTDPGAGH